MMKEKEQSGLPVLANTKLVNKIYEDLAAPGIKKLGKALGTVLDITNTIVWPVKWANERAKFFFENNLDKYRKKIEAVPEENIVEAPSEIATPILDRFQYVSNEELSNLFVNLLASASNAERIQKAHPGFVSIIDRLSPDEARILLYLRDVKTLPVITLGWRDLEHGAVAKPFQNVSLLQEKVSLLFPDNSEMYFQNLISLGLTENVGYVSTIYDPEYKKIEEKYKSEHSSFMPDFVRDFPGTEEQYKYNKKGSMSITRLGLEFLQACSPD